MCAVTSFRQIVEGDRQNSGGVSKRLTALTDLEMGTFYNILFRCFITFMLPVVYLQQQCFLLVSAMISIVKSLGQYFGGGNNTHLVIQLVIVNLEYRESL